MENILGTKTAIKIIILFIEKSTERIQGNRSDKRKQCGERRGADAINRLYSLNICDNKESWKNKNYPAQFPESSNICHKAALRPA